MIKIPAFVIGGLLILTGIFGYILQDPGLSIKIMGPLDEELETGLHELSSTKPEIRIGYFAYLILAEIQERLIQEIS